MRSFESASSSWQEIRQCRTLHDLRAVVRLEGRTPAATTGLRSACWKAFLLFDSVDTDQWPRILLSSRSAYNSLRLHFLRYLDDQEDGDVDLDHVGDGVESSLRKDEELRAEIIQDVERCMPENLYFRQPETQKMLLDVLFIYCKLNPDIGYRQGMHELLAPLIWVVERDAIELGPSSKAMGEDAIIKTVFDADYIEHDAFALFAQVMQSAKGFYEQTTHAATDNPMVVRSQRIVSELLPLVDQELANHLREIEIVPQVFLMRWIRLLFGREFGYDDMLTIWDVIFAEDPSLDLVNEISLVMLLRIRWDLIDADYNAALTLLLRYPPLEKEHVPQNLALDALYLRDHMHAEGGSYVVLKYTGRPLQPTNRPLTPPALQRNITTFSGENALRAITSASPLRSGRQQRYSETLLQSTAKNIYARGESFGIGKVVRSAVDEVHKKAQEIRDAQVRYSPRAQTPRMPSTGPAAVYARLKALEARNSQLAKLLEGTVSELWDYQKSTNNAELGGEATNTSSEHAEKLGIAIAKLQFVQVYLADSSLSLPDDAVPLEEQKGEAEIVEEKTSHKSVDDKGDQVQASGPFNSVPDVPKIHLDSPSGASQNSKPRSEEKGSEESDLAGPNETDSGGKATHAVDQLNQPDIPSSEATSPPSTIKVRPALEQSSFSWMLGQEETQTQPKTESAATLPPEPGRRRGFLFGDDEAETERIVYSPRRKAGKGVRHKKVPSVSTAGEDAFKAQERPDETT